MPPPTLTGGRGGGTPWPAILLSLVAGLLILVLPTAGGAWWFLREVDRQFSEVGRQVPDVGRQLPEAGAESPELAALAWLYGLRFDVGPWSGPHVDADAAEVVTAVRAATIRALRANRATLEVGAAPAGQGGGDGGEVVEWWYVSTGTGATTRDAARPWRFATVTRGNSSWITAVHPPPMCGRDGYFPSCP